MAKLYPDVVKFIVETRNNQNVTFEKLAEMLDEKFGIRVTATTVRNRYVQHRYDHIADKIQQAEGK
ncbi:hypothetical protein B0181_11665 [Moraxella caviae]|uniref:Uncharacterized protein n=1 Tax=Moraxella caviae TaxID=34060 RepID=A0A1S9ZSN9_9GAMM|nr:hypothetical protein [Moraxella caviae]OOR86546.1 hypothetical protein B0181_11665 [Moraxella caviae]STZ13539.1 Uncharacterised protein [Moraxella caviae]VEW10210.1 Uncharacterised protein [Moraxella caviae]